MTHWLNSENKEEAIKYYDDPDYGAIELAIGFDTDWIEEYNFSSEEYEFVELLFDCFLNGVGIYKFIKKQDGSILLVVQDSDAGDHVLGKRKMTVHEFAEMMDRINNDSTCTCDLDRLIQVRDNILPPF